MPIDDEYEEQEPKGLKGQMRSIEASIIVDWIALPYRVAYDILKARDDWKLDDVVPNEYYPEPGAPIEIESMINSLKAHPEQREAVEEAICKARTPEDKWGYYFAHFLLPYDIDSFSYFDLTGALEPEDEEAKQTAVDYKRRLLEAQQDCIQNPEKYYRGSDRVVPEEYISRCKSSSFLLHERQPETTETVPEAVSM